MSGYGLDLISYQDTITAEVKRLYAPDFEVLEDTLADDHILTRDKMGKMDAFIILRYGPKLPKRRGKSFAGVRHDEYYATVDVMAIASKGRTARYLCDAVTNDLLGFKPDGVSGMTIQDDGGMFAAFVVSSNEARPTRSIASERLRFNVNNTQIGTTGRPATP